MTPLPENRRSFVKKTLATSASISLTGLIRAHGEGGAGITNTTVQTTSGTIGSGSSTSATAATVPQTVGTITSTTSPATSQERKGETRTRYRLICIAAPESRVGLIGWLQAASASDIATAVPHNVKVQATRSPGRGDVSFGKLGITVIWEHNLPSASITKYLQVSKTVERKLYYRRVNAQGRAYDSFYDGRWLRPTDERPACDYEDCLNSAGDVPHTLDGPSLAFDVGPGLTVDASIARAGYFIGSLNVTGGTNEVNDVTYVTSDSQTSKTQKGAELSLGAPDTNGEVSISPKSISVKSEIKNKSGFNISSSGKSTATKEYGVQESSSGTKTFGFSGTCSSSLTAEVAMDWKVIIQAQEKRVVVDGNGSLVKEDPPGPWLPALPANPDGIGVEDAKLEPSR